ncbi:MAG: DNA polymerase III subunit gamma/tau [Spirochaetes bacterium]|nr:DNA polymerase III subunit gamma/tau [Spirochaetota bacterium]
MEKEALTLKFRPQSFEEFVGQSAITIVLKNSIKTNNIFHAYLFYGPRGVGKTSAARIFAKMLNCKEGPTQKPCNKCENCAEITKGNSPDVVEIDGASNRGINEIRELQESIRYVPIKSKYKIYIIDEVHMLTKEAFNALLKTLEEPPKNVIFIFATTEIHKVLPTIRSRCQQFQFHLFTTDEIIQHLKYVLSQYNIKYDEKAIFWIAKYAYGSMRDALSILSQVLATKTSEINEEIVLKILGVHPFEIIVKLFDSFVSKDLKRIYEIIQQTYISGIDFNNFILQIVEFLRDISLIKVGIENQNYLSLTLEQIEDVKKFKDIYTHDKLLLMIEKLSEFSKNLNYFYNPYPYFENLLVSFAFIDNYIPNSEIIRNIKFATSYIEKLFIDKGVKIKNVSDISYKRDELVSIADKADDFSEKTKIKIESMKDELEDKTITDDINKNKKVDVKRKHIFLEKDFDELMKKEVEIEEKKINNDNKQKNISKDLKDEVIKNGIKKIENLLNQKKNDILSEEIPSKYVKIMEIIDSEYIKDEGDLG